MTRRITALLSALALAGAALFTGAGGIALPVALASSYNGPCGLENNWHWYVYRTGSLSFTQSHGESTIGTYLACTGTTGTGSDMTVLATLQGATITGSNLAQCGIGQITGEGTHAWYTPDNNGAWQRFSTQPRIQLGDYVTCDVYATSDGMNDAIWWYSFTNVTTGQTVTGYSPRSGYATEVWNGLEVSYDGDMFGSEGSSSPEDAVVYPAYKYTTGGSSLWYMTDNAANIVGGCDTVHHRCPGHSYWVDEYNFIGTQQYDRVAGYTDLH